MNDHIEATLLLGYVYGALNNLCTMIDSKNDAEIAIQNLRDELADKINKIYYSTKD